MENSPRLGLSYVMPQQAQKHVTVNESFRRLDAIAQLSVLSAGLSAEPGSPEEGDCYVVPSSATGASWAAMTAGSIAAYQDGAWNEIIPGVGWRAWVIDTAALMAFDGANWIAAGASGGSPSPLMLGINTVADAVNRLSVKSDAVLFDQDDVTPGAGDSRVKVNKAAAANTASHLFQTGYSGRAEFGLTGDDDFHLKVSADGSVWRDAITVDKDTGFAGLVQQSSPQFPIDIIAGSTGASTLNGRSINPAGVAVSTTSGRSGFLLSNTNSFVPDGNSDNSIFQFHFPFDGGNDAFKVFRIARGSTLSDVFWINLGGGAVFGTPSGGDKGPGAINAEAVYDDNALLSCYVFDQALDGAIDTAKWDARVPDRRAPDLYRQEIDPETGEERSVKIDDGEVVEERIHEPLRKFSARIATDHNPLSLDGYAKHWREKRHLTSLPNEARFDPLVGLSAGDWIQRLVETVEIHAVLIEQLNRKLKKTPGAQAASSPD